MNKPLIITIAITVLLLAIGSWVYLLLFGAPQSTSDVFTDLGITPSNDTALPAPLPTNNTTSTIPGPSSVDGAPLQQLSLRKVAGFVASDERVRFVEQGTGHVYDINVESGNETRISNTSIPQVTTAHLNETGDGLVLISEMPNARKVVAARLENGGLTTQSLPPDTRNITFVGTSTIHYTRATTEGTTGYAYELTDATQRERFRIPLTAVTTVHRNNTTYLYNRPATELEGALFRINNNQLILESKPRFGLVATVGAAGYVTTYASTDELVNEYHSFSTSTVYTVPLMTMPEKCAWNEPFLYCAAPLDTVTHTYPIDWYQGAIRGDDALWRINPREEIATLLVNPNTTIGRPLDIERLQRTDNQRIIFINRLDTSLWLYDENLD